MKRPLSFLVAALVAGSSLLASAQAEKQFQTGVSGLGYHWAFCREGDRVHYAVFSHGARPRALGEPAGQEYVTVTNGGSQHPKAVLHYGPRDARDLFASEVQLYQVERDGKITPGTEHVTSAELKAFMLSQPKEYTVAALETFVRRHRTAKE